MIRLKELREEFAHLQTEAQGIVDAAVKEKRDLTDDETKANETRFSRMTQVKKQLDEDHRFASLAIAAAVEGKPVVPSGSVQIGENGPTLQFSADAPGRQEYERNREAGLTFSLRPGESEEGAKLRYHRDAVNNFIRTGQEPDKRFTLITTTGTGVLVPGRIGPPMTIKRQSNPFRAALLARGLQPIKTDGMESLTVPIFDDSANSADVIPQNATGDNPKDPALSGLLLAAGLYDSGTVWSSNTLINSAGFDLMGYLEPLLEERIDQTQAAAWITLLQAGTIGKTTASTTGVTYSELLDWQHSIPVVRRSDGVFFVSDGLLRAIRGLVDSTGQPLFQLSMRDDVPDTLLGWPIFAVVGLPTPATGVVSGIAASASALAIRDVNNRRIARYSNQPNWPDQVGIRMFTNGGFNFVGSYVRTLKHA